MNDSATVNLLLFTALICMGLFLFAGGGGLLDKWIDGARVRRSAIREKMPGWSIKPIRFIFYIVYAAFVVFIFFYYVDE